MTGRPIKLGFVESGEIAPCTEAASPRQPATFPYFSYASSLFNGSVVATFLYLCWAGKQNALLRRDIQDKAENKKMVSCGKLSYNTL